MPNKWYVMTGGPSTGKTTLLAELEKLGHKTVPEAARRLIDEALAAGTPTLKLRANEEQFQYEVAKLKERVEATLDAEQTVFFDRGMQDTIAYMEAIGSEISAELRTIVDKSRYRKVFLLEPLESYSEDYARTEDKATIERLDNLLYNAYHEAGMEVIRVPAQSVEKRLKFVLDNL